MKSKKQRILITGCAGFIGFHLTLRLLNNKKYKVYGIDNINNYYDLNLKKDRLAILKQNKNFNFYKINIEINNQVLKNFRRIKYDYIIHLAAQAGVRHSITNPRPYLDANINGFFNILDAARLIKVKHLIYASTSSVYGESNKFPLRENYPTSSPNSFYAATKKANEVMAYAYSHIYKMKTTGLRFFTVYGPYGRPDMALFKFTKAITENKYLELFNKGDHQRDFTYIDDIVQGIINLINVKNKDKFQLFNIGSGRPKRLRGFLYLIEKFLGKKAKTKMRKFQIGDVYKTHASISKIQNEIGYKPRFKLSIGIKNFIEWYKEYYTK